MYSKSISTAFAATLFASANAHFFIKTPSPIPGSAVKPPLDPSGSDFPCHGADMSSGPVTDMAVGSTQPLQFELGGGANTAVHGGGSCQIAITYETDPAKQKDLASWKVIHTYLGGCPTNAMGNLDTGAGAVPCPESSPGCVNQNLGFEIPSEVQDGQAVLAWMWYNNIGNRETYMNCARVNFSGGSGQLDALPGMAIANIASLNSCKTTEQFNTDFANPGKYVTTDSTLNYPLKQMVGSGCDGGAGSGGNSPAGGSPSTGSPSTGAPSGGSGSDGGYGSAPQSPAPSAAPVTPQEPQQGSGNDGQYGGGNNGGVFAPGASAPAEAPAAPVPTTMATSVAAPAATAPASPPASGGYASAPASGSCSNGQVACTAEGFYCIDATTFGMCNWGCAMPQAMSAGTQCMANAVAHAVVPQRRRSMRHFNHARAHMNMNSA